MWLSRSLAGLALGCLVLLASTAQADIAPPLPLRFHLGHVTVLAASTAPAADVARVTGALRDAMREGIRDIERCASRVHGGFSRRDRREGHARVRVVFDGSSSPSETRMLSSDFAHGIGACIQSGLRGVAVVPPPAGMVVLTVGFDRD